MGMKAYSKDLRIRVLDALDQGTPRTEVVRLFRVSSPTITRWRRRRRETGSLSSSVRRGPPGPKRAALRAGLLAQVQAHPDATLEQHCTWWEAAHGMRVSPATMSRVITRDLGWTRKKSP
jgi:transposase